MYITKQELLKEINISYSQLYRYKRAGLIPESWFIKRACSTGQETIFDKEKIIERIQWIKDHKSELNFEQMKEALEQTKHKIYTKSELESITSLDRNIVSEWLYHTQSDIASQFETVCMYALSHWKQKQYYILPLIETFAKHATNINDLDCTLYLMQFRTYSYLCCLKQAPVVLDDRFQIKESIHLVTLLPKLQYSYE